MKKRLIQILKWFFIVLGVLFFIQAVLAIGMIFSINKLSTINFPTIKNSNKNLKEMQPLINYAEKYFEENSKYPTEIKDIKLKKDIEYTYETTKNADCYTIKLKSKKNNSTKQYQHCSIKTDNSSSNSQSYIEYNN